MIPLNHTIYNAINGGYVNMNNNEHYANDNELGLMRSFMCYPTSLYVDIFPLVSNIKNKSSENECGMDQLRASVIKIVQGNMNGKHFMHQDLIIYNNRLNIIIIIIYGE